MPLNRSDGVKTLIVWISSFWAVPLYTACAASIVWALNGYLINAHHLFSAGFKLYKTPRLFIPDYFKVVAELKAREKSGTLTRGDQIAFKVDRYSKYAAIIAGILFAIMDQIWMHSRIAHP